MFRFLVVLVACSLALSGEAADDVTKGTELLFTFLVNRHGDRTITSSSDASYTDTPEPLLELAETLGYGQLTNKGKRTAYHLGQYIHERYSELLTPKYNRSEVYIKSTDFTRTRMTILSALAAIYPPVEPRWSEVINWEPVPYTTLPVKYDYDEPTFNCPVYSERLTSNFRSNPPEMSEYSDLLAQLTTILGIDFTSNPLLVLNVEEVLESQISAGIPLSAQLEPLYGEIKSAAFLANDLLYDIESNLSLQAGPLLNDFLEQAALVISGETTQKLRIHSAHDFNVFVFEAIIHATPLQGPPRYAAALSLELRNNTSTGELVVLPVYLPAPGENPIYLNIEGCSSLLCPYEEFYQINSKYALTVDDWRSLCGWTEDLVVPESEIQ